MGAFTHHLPLIDVPMGTLVLAVGDDHDTHGGGLIEGRANYEESTGLLAIPVESFYLSFAVKRVLLAMSRFRSAERVSLSGRLQTHSCSNAQSVNGGDM
jgi:hypothetical protein